MIKEQQLTDCAAVASDLAAATFGLEVLEAGIEDHDNNFTRFLLLSRSAVSALLPPQAPAKTSLVFVLPNVAGALYKALACFSLRDIDFSKIESRPTSVDLLSQLSSTTMAKGSAAGDLPRFRYTFYLDFLAPQYSDGAQNALLHLKEQSEFVRVLGSYPSSGTGLVGPVKAALAALDAAPSLKQQQQLKPDPTPTITSATNSKQVSRPLSIAIVGFGKFGQFLARTFIKQGHTVKAIDKDDMSSVANDMGADFHPLYDLSPLMRQQPVDVLLLSVSIISFEEVLRTLPRELFSNRLVVDVLSVKVHAKESMLKLLPVDCDILCTHPMFGPESGKHGWQGLPFLFDRIRVNSDHDRTQRFLNIWEAERCKMIEMSCEKHDEYAANSQFITHLTGRVLGQQNLQPTPIDTKGFQTVLSLVENTCKDSFDLFFGLYYYNSYAASQLQRIREALSKVERQLAAKEAYLAARSEASNEQRGRILEECRSLIKEALSDFVPVKDKRLEGDNSNDSSDSK